MFTCTLFMYTRIEIDFILNSADVVLLPSMITTTTISSILNNQGNNSSSSDNEVTSFLFHLRDETYRKTILKKLTECRRIKQNEINICQEEIQVIDEILEFISQYRIKHSNNQLTSDEMQNPDTEDVTLNMLNTNSDLTVFDNPITNTTDQYCLPVDSTDDMPIDPLSSLFSLFPTNLFSDVSTINDPVQDITIFNINNKSND
ncbi:unnamed protein product [Adineta steineri]|uniref:Uncharacterized protein n=2 Tax=Adineta steineri TaxID=433720 RepID=A0A813W1K0_9BILA|nr:unnamed protein product [Adineta steineri]